VAVWDDAIKYAKDKLDLKWVHINLGAWMYDYFKHDRSYVLNAEDQVLYSMADGKQVSVGRRLPMGKIPEVVSELRERIRNGALDRYEKGQQRVPRAFDLGFVDDRPAIISAIDLAPAGVPDLS
jgi:sensor domain CHASE-containing protein